MIRVMVVDDHRLVREGFEALLGGVAAVEVVAAARTRFQEQTAGEPYRCPIPQDQEPPLPRGQ